MNWWRPSKRPQDLALEPEVHHDSEIKAAAHKQNPILLLQRAVGNRAVQKMLPGSEGAPIALGERLELETAFAQDLSEVRIHRDEDAAQLAADAGAIAFTTGRDIYFAPGAYGSAALAHEVSHVIQQAQATSFSPGEDAFLEHQATVASSAVMSGHAAEISSPASAPAMQRQPAPRTQPLSFKLLPADSLTLDSFDIDKISLSVSHKQKLDEFAKRLKNALASASNSVITIVGFADASGTQPHNLALGQQRAEAVRDYLVAKGISESQLHTCSLGEGSPSVMSKRYEAENRRVEIDVVERNFLKPSILTPPGPVPAPPAVTPSNGIDLKYHPEPHEPTLSAECQERLRQIDKAVREALAAEKAKPGTSVGDVTGHVLRNAARKLGLPPWIQDRAESLGQDLPFRGAQAVLDQLAAEKSLSASSQNALKGLVDGLMRTKLR